MSVSERLYCISPVLLWLQDIQPVTKRLDVFSSLVKLPLQSKCWVVPKIIKSLVLPNLRLTIIWFKILKSCGFETQVTARTRKCCMFCMPKVFIWTSNVGKCQSTSDSDRSGQSHILWKILRVNLIAWLRLGF